MVHPNDITRPIFIVGSRGSGRTLLRNLLSAHSQIAATSETLFLNHVSEGEVSKGALVDFEACRADYISSLRTHDSGIAFLPRLFEWFPEARVLFTQRDPRAVVAAQMKSPDIQETLAPRSFRHGLLTGSREQALVVAASDWIRNHEEMTNRWAKDPRFYTVIYENLVRNTESEMRAILKFLGEELEVPGASYFIDDTPEAWKNELTASEIAMVEGCCGQTMRAHGYNPSMSSARQFMGRHAAALLAFSGDFERRGRKVASAGRRHVRASRRSLELILDNMAAAGIARGIQPAWFGYRGVKRETVQEYFARNSGTKTAGSYETVHPEEVAHNPLPLNFPSRDALPDVQGWWGYSFWDVPERTSAETFIATVPDCLITWYKHPEKNNDFYPAILNKDSRAFDMRELRFRPLHATTLLHSPKPARLKKATWFIERVYHNHSHWLTAHLPRLLLMREKGLLDQALLPTERTDAIDGSLQMLGLKPEDFQTYNPDRPLFVEELTILGTDRFRPELLQMVPEAFGVLEAGPPHRKVFISRLQATRRRLVNEEEIWAFLKPQGFERVLMENLSFEAQVQLMRETAVLMAPHGAGLTNMIFCPKGAHIIEIADLSFPNPNFYALASAMGHHYWLIPAESLGDVHPLEKDLTIDPDAVRKILARLEELSPNERQAEVNRKG